MRLTPRNIGQRQEIFSCLISYLYANAMQATNQGVGSSNLSGRANNSLCVRYYRFRSDYYLSAAAIGFRCIYGRVKH